MNSTGTYLRYLAHQEERSRREKERSRLPNGLAVVLIDMQPYFIQNTLPADFARMLTAQQRLLRTCTQYEIPVAVVENEGNGCTISLLQEQIRQLPLKERISKRNWNGFLDTNLMETLRSWNSQSLCFSGVYAKECVKETIESAITLGYHISTAEDLIAPYYPEDNSKKPPSRDYLLWYRRKGTYYPSCEEMLKSWKIGVIGA
jgi:nicotinamidase-related amidase